jgi:threonine aldolase
MLESSHNLCNGRVLSTKYINDVKKICDAHKIKLHLDGARALNASTFLKIEPAKMVKDFDTINFCLSKGMGCPIGSMVIGTREDIAHARIVAKLLGGALRQAGVLAACGLVSLEDWQDKL